MQLLLPQKIFCLFQTSPVCDGIGKLMKNPVPMIFPLLDRMFWMFINPMLEFINGRHPWKGFDDVLQLFQLCA